MGARSDDENKLRAFGKLIPSLILSGPPGVAVIGGVPKVQDVVSYWPALMKKSLINPKIARYDGRPKDELEITNCQSGNFQASEDQEIQTAEKATMAITEVLSKSQQPNARPLYDICLARSGDKGDMANIGVLARGPKCFEFIESFLTAQKVKNYFQEICYGTVTRYKIEGLLGLNFLLDKSLGGGGTKTLRTDAQGKTFSQALLRQKTIIPDDVLEEARTSN
ncbi:MAG: hypothetical protein R3B45_07180 [Bdellovibrionota bacterium]